jgi:LmbE family N-acetylglucosaminyl deacetylase
VGPERANLPERLAVVSPHLDDAVLSLGGLIAAAARQGTRVSVITVFAGDPNSAKPSGGWDRRGGFATEGDAARARRAEDRAACAVVGAEPVWLDHSEADYADARDESAIREDVWAAARGAGALLVPGFPLTNPDHVLVTRLLLRGGGPVETIGFYAEQPYRYWVRREQPRPTSEALLAATETLAPPSWTRLGIRLGLVRTKRRAILEYRSQVALLGLDRDKPARLDRLLAHELRCRGEAIAWLPSR